jgi:hypothetical protein
MKPLRRLLASGGGRFASEKRHCKARKAICFNLFAICKSSKGKLTRQCVAEAALMKRAAPSQTGLSHSRSFDQRRRPETFLTAIAMAFFWPSRITSRLPRVTPV